MPDMLVKLYELDHPQPLIDAKAKEGYLIRRARAYEKHKVLDFVGTHFSEGWCGECDVSFSKSPIAVFIATYESKILGFAAYDAACLNFFGPTGVSEDARGKGLGKLLLLAALQDMRDQGYGYAVIGGVGPAEFYAKVVGATMIEGSKPGTYTDMLE
jgi:GNAT superfamily N-acetyltransferase